MPPTTRDAVLPAHPSQATRNADHRSAHAIRSYVLRAGRITPAQQRALAELWPRFGVAYAPEPLDLDALFGHAAPRTLEIGFGNGDSLLARALSDPGRDFLGIEVHRPGIGHLLLRAAAADLRNLRVIGHDAVEVLQRQLRDDSLDEVQLLFPDPWPKKRHHKRRLVQPAIIELLAARLRAGGRLHIATDWPPYAEQMLADLTACPALERVSLAPGERTVTRFEKRGARLGHHIYEFLFLRRV